MSNFISIDLRSLSTAQAALGAQIGQLPFVLARALTVTAHAVNREIRVEMGAKIAGGATPYTLRAFEVQMATRQTLRAEVRLRPTPDTAGRGTPYERSLGHLFRPGSGARQFKRIEKLLAFRGLMPAGMQLAPAPGLRLDARGNPRPADIHEMLGILRSSIRNLRTFRAVSKRGQQQRAVGFFVVVPGAPASKHLAPGIWRRDETGNRSVVHPWFRFVSPPGYRQLFNLSAIAQRVVDTQFSAALDQSVTRALASPRP